MVREKILTAEIIYLYVGELWVNDARIVAWKEEGNALIIALEDYLFKREVQKEVGVEEFENHEIDKDFQKSKIGESEQQVPREWGDSSQVCI